MGSKCLSCGVKKVCVQSFILRQRDASPRQPVCFAERKFVQQSVCLVQAPLLRLDRSARCRFDRLSPSTQVIRCRALQISSASAGIPARGAAVEPGAWVGARCCVT